MTIDEIPGNMHPRRGPPRVFKRFIKIDAKRTCSILFWQIVMLLKIWIVMPTKKRVGHVGDECDMDIE